MYFFLYLNSIRCDVNEWCEIFKASIKSETMGSIIGANQSKVS